MDYFTAIIVEDEELPRLSLVQKIEAYHPDVKIADACRCWESAMDSILRNRPDILFLDIQVGDDNSIDMLPKLEKMMKLPHIIFTTAYNDPAYLLRAIKFSAEDYLLKPIRITELAEALQKIRNKSSAPYDIPGAPRTEPHVPEIPYSFRTVQGIIYGNVENIFFFKADGNYTTLFHSGGEDLVLERLGAIAGKLNSRHFLRAGRSIVLNKKYIYKVDKRKSLCILKIPDGKMFQIPLSEGALKAVLFSG